MCSGLAVPARGKSFTRNTHSVVVSLFVRDTLSAAVQRGRPRLPWPQLPKAGVGLPGYLEPPPPTLPQFFLDFLPIKTCQYIQNLYAGFEYEFRRKNLGMIFKYIRMVD